MKAFSMSVFVGLLCATGSVAAAPGSLTDFPLKVLPVLVQVNANGKVTDASPAVRLTPKLTRLLDRSLDEMIVAPAKVRGKAVSSQFVINLRLSATPREKGDYDVRFAYVSTAPVPSGSWYWVHEDGRRLSLARQGAMHRVHHYDRFPTRNIMPTRNRPVSMPSANRPTHTGSHNTGSSATRGRSSGR